MEIRKLLVANRGEIAARVFATCGRLGITTVAVAAPDDARAFHTRRADEVHEIASYLDAGEVVRAAREAEADAVHPGYGFLAESPEFAEAVVAAGLAWVGPPPDVLRASGDKLESKRIAAEAGVPVVPTGAPEEIGFPLMIKAAAGGGGRGMRVVRSADALDDAVAAARREAKAGFGDDTIFFERYVERPRHVEIQLLGDAAGKVIHLGERDCSIQRRHQKVLEESPSPALGDARRAEIADAAIALAGRLGYVGAGTAEFMVDENGNFFFLELNARIQVEHPVTELVTGIDIVEQQVRIAAGEPLALESVEPSGHAVEVRLYAEDPRSFLPQSGRVTDLWFSDAVRVDAGIEPGDDVPVAYDPLIAKLIAHADAREDALERLSGALAETRVRGVTTNLPLLRWLVRHPEVRAGRTTTAFLVENPPLARSPRVPRPWRGYWRLNRDPLAPAPPPEPPPLVEAAAQADATGGGELTVTAPMPGTVIRVLIEAGARVAQRQPLVILEAMKMETPLLAPYEGTVRQVNVTEGDRVAGGAVLVELER